MEAADVEDEVGWNVHLLAHSVDIRLRGVLVRWCPPLDDGADGGSVVLHSIGSQQSESSSVAPLHCLELIKALVVLLFQQTVDLRSKAFTLGRVQASLTLLLLNQAFPLILAPADIQRIAIS